MSTLQFTMLWCNAGYHPEWHALLQREATAIDQHANHGLTAPDETILADNLQQQVKSGPRERPVVIGSRFQLCLCLIRSYQARPAGQHDNGPHSPR